MIIYSYELKLGKPSIETSSWTSEVDGSYLGDSDDYFEYATFEDMIIYAESLVSAEAAKELVVAKLFELAKIFKFAKDIFQNYEGRWTDDDN